jgi:hypothetical protein
MERSFGHLGTFWDENPCETVQAAPQPRRPGLQVSSNYRAPGVVRVVRNECYPPIIYLLPITKPFLFTSLALDHVISFLTDTERHDCAYACVLFLCSGAHVGALQFVAPTSGIDFPRLGKLLSFKLVSKISPSQRDFWSRFVWGSGLACEQQTLSEGTLQASFRGYPTVLIATRRKNARKAKAKAERVEAWQRCFLEKGFGP